jgi:hypothetical protein
MVSGSTTDPQPWVTQSIPGAVENRRVRPSPRNTTNTLSRYIGLPVRRVRSARARLPLPRHRQKQRGGGGASGSGSLSSGSGSRLPLNPPTAEGHNGIEGGNLTPFKGGGPGGLLTSGGSVFVCSYAAQSLSSFSSSPSPSQPGSGFRPVNDARRAGELGVCDHRSDQRQQVGPSRFAYRDDLCRGQDEDASDAIVGVPARRPQV